MSDIKQIIFFLDEIDYVKSNIEKSTGIERTNLVARLLNATFQLKAFDKIDVEKAKGVYEYRKNKINEEVKVKKYEQSNWLFYYFLLFMILFSKSKHKAFLLLALNIFFEENKNEYKNK